MTDAQSRYPGQGSDSLEAGAEMGSSGGSMQGGSSGGAMQGGAQGGSAGQAVSQVAQESKEAVVQTAQETVSTAKQAAQDISQQVQQQAGDVIEQTAGQLADTAVQVKQQATTAFVDQRDKAVSGLNGLAEALRQTARSLSEAAGGDSQIPAGIAPLVDEAAERLSQSADFLREKDITGLLSEAQQLAKKQPALFMGGMFAVGLVGARLLKGTMGDDSQSGSSSGTGQGMGGQSQGSGENWFATGGSGVTASGGMGSGGAMSGGAMSGGMGSAGGVSGGTTEWQPGETLSTRSGDAASPSGASIFDDLPEEPRTGTMTGGSISGGMSTTGGSGSSS